MVESPSWGDVSFVSRSKPRKSVFEALDKPQTPTELSKRLKLDRGYVSTILKELEKRGLAECLTPDEIRHRLFRRTPQGESVLKTMQDTI